MEEEVGILEFISMKISVMRCRELTTLKTSSEMAKIKKTNLHNIKRKQKKQTEMRQYRTVLNTTDCKSFPVAFGLSARKCDFVQMICLNLTQSSHVGRFIFQETSGCVFWAFLLQCRVPESRFHIIHTLRSPLS